MAKMLITTVEVNFELITSEANYIGLNCCYLNFGHQLISSQPFLGSPL